MASVFIFGAKYLVVLLPLAIIYVFWQSSAETRRILALRGLLVLAVGVILAKGSGMVYNDPRPFVTGHFTPLIPHEPDNGFPSDHTLLAFSCVFLILPFTAPLAWGGMLVATLVGLSRIACGLHTPLDIVASILFAAIANGIAYAVIRNQTSKPDIAS